MVLMSASEATGEKPSEVTITIRANGPLLVQGDVKLINAAGEEVDRGGRVAFCRCGHSANKPFCDASHKAQGFVAD